MRLARALRLPGVAQVRFTCCAQCTDQGKLQKADCQLPMLLYLQARIRDLEGDLLARMAAASQEAAEAAAAAAEAAGDPHGLLLLTATGRAGLAMPNAPLAGTAVTAGGASKVRM